MYVVKHYQIATQSELEGLGFDEGSIYFVEDTKRIYMDPVGSTTRILVTGDPIILNTEAERKAILAPVPGKIYIVIESAKIYIYQNGAWFSTGGGSTSIKAGIIYINPSNTLPDGFLWCNGTAYSRTEYTELFVAIGTKYGEGDGSTTFNVPDLSEKIPIGSGDNYDLGETSTSDSVVIVNTGSITNSNNVGANSYTVVNYMISTGKGSSISIKEIIEGVQALPLGVEYGGTGCTNIEDLKTNLGIKCNLPEVTTADNGKFLTVVDGVWTPTSISYIEGSSF